MKSYYGRENNLFQKKLLFMFILMIKMLKIICDVCVKNKLRKTRNINIIKEKQKKQR